MIMLLEIVGLYRIFMRLSLRFYGTRDNETSCCVIGFLPMLILSVRWLRRRRRRRRDLLIERLRVDRCEDAEVLLRRGLRVYLPRVFDSSVFGRRGR